MKLLVKKQEKGITLIALVITIIVLLILASVSIVTLIGENGLLTQVDKTKFLHNVAQIKEQIEVYKTGEYLNGKEDIEAYPIAKEQDRKLTIQDMLSEEELKNLPEELKYQMLTMSLGDTGTDIPSLEQLDYSKFYKLDTDLITSGKEYKDRLVIFVDGDNYKVIHVDGIMYEKKKVYIIIPLNNEEEPQYITANNNTYKFYGDGTIKVIGQKSAISGDSSENIQKRNGNLEIDISKINADFGNKMVLPEKKMYISTGTIYVIDQNNDLWAWGDNSYNKLGQGNSYLVTEPIKILEGRTEGEEGVKAKNVWAGSTNTFVVDTNNQVWIAGANHSGSLGQGNQNIYTNYVKVTDLDGSKIEEVSASIGTQTSNIFVRYSDGTIYLAGNNSWGQLGIGNGNNQNRFVALENYNEEIVNVKKVVANGTCSFLLRENGELYGAGYNGNGVLGISDTSNKIKWTLISNNIEDIVWGGASLICKDKEGNIYRIGSKLNKINNIPQDTNNQLSSEKLVLADGKMYLINDNNTASIYNEGNQLDVFQAVNNRVFKMNGKYYIYAAYNIATPKEASIYQLETIFKDAIYMQGTGENISMVNKNGEIYENLVKNTELQNIKKLISSGNARYAITKQNQLFVKGSLYTGMWGELTTKNNYLQATTDGIHIFENIKDIYTSQSGQSAAFTTTDGKLYWAGSTAFITLPGITGDISTPGMGTITQYPKEVTSTVVDAIKDKIKDIKYAFINGGGINGKVTYIITENEELYTIASNSNMAGNGKKTPDFEKLVIKEGTTVQQVETANGLTIAVLSNGEIYGWGYNTYGILGDGYEVGGVYPTPVKMNLPNNIRSVSLGKGFAIFASKSGEVYGIGQNDYGQLGTGDNKGAETFVRCTELEK